MNRDRESGTLQLERTHRFTPPAPAAVCVARECLEWANETGYCARHEAARTDSFARLLVSVDAAALAPAHWYREQLGWRITVEQAQFLKLAVVAEMRARLNPTVALNRIPAQEVAALAEGRYDAAAVPSDKPLRDFARDDVADAPANRERRAALMDTLPRVHAPAPRGDFHLRFAIGAAMVLLAIGAVLAWR